MPIKLLHTADVHLGAKLSYLATKASEHRRQIAATFAKVVEIALQEKVDVFMVGGDLFDSPYPGKFEIAQVIDALGKLIEKGIYVAIIAGNHDRIEPGSIFRTAEFMNFDSQKLRIFAKSKVEQWYIPELDLTIHAASVVEQKSKHTQLTGFQKNPASKYNIALLHGSVDILGSPENYPIFKKDIEMLNFDYLALGDWHSTLDVSTDSTVAWYPGSPELIAPSQRGAGNILLATIDNSTKVVPVGVGSKKSQALDVDLGLFKTQEELRKHLLQFKDPDLMLVVTVNGLIDLDNDFDMDQLLDVLRDNFYYLQIKDQSQLKLDKEELAKYSPDFVIGRYIRILEGYKEQGKLDEELVQDAIQLGVQLLLGKRNVD